MRPEKRQTNTTRPKQPPARGLRDGWRPFHVADTRCATTRDVVLFDTARDVASGTHRALSAFNSTARSGKRVSGAGAGSTVTGGACVQCGGYINDCYVACHQLRRQPRRLHDCYRDDDATMAVIATSSWRVNDRAAVLVEDIAHHADSTT